MKYPKKLTSWYGVVCMLLLTLFSGCVVLDIVGNKHSMRPMMRGEPVTLKTQPKGKICFTGYQINENYRGIDNCDMLMGRFLTVLNPQIRSHLIINHFSPEAMSEYATSMDRENINVHWATTANNQISISDRFSAFTLGENDRMMSDNCLIFLSTKVDADYYLSVVGDFFVAERLSQNPKNKPSAIIAVYNNSGKKIFCKIYVREYDENKKENLNISYYLDLLLQDCAAEMNTDMAFIEKM
jgi:hypothetical protein